jgi:MFS family permease
MMLYGHGWHAARRGLAGPGFSLVFPALAVEAANVFPTSVRGSVLGVYSAFIDLSLFLSGPIAGAIIHLYGYLAAFLAIAGTVLLALTLSIWLASSAKPPIAGRGIACRLAHLCAGFYALNFIALFFLNIKTFGSQNMQQGDGLFATNDGIMTSKIASE